MSFQQGLSGLNASSKNLEVIGNNIANANTFGSKAARAEFSDVYASALNGAGINSTGIGTRVAAVSQQFTQGSVTTTENPMDLAINGAGFFQMLSPNNQTTYTRNGQFKVDNAGYIVNNAQNRLMGYPGGANGGEPTPLQLPTGRLAPNSTETISVEMNLDARSTITFAGATPPVDFNVSSTYNNATSVTVYDDLGQEISLTIYFQKSAANVWNVYGTANGENLPTPGSNPAALTTITYAPNGTAPVSSAASFTIPPVATGGGGTTLPVVVASFDVADSTQFGSAFGVTDLEQDGFASGELTSITVENNGVVTARYSNGESDIAGQVELATFRNPQGLQPVGDNAWARTSASGEPTRNIPGAGNLGVLQAGALEESNVDLTGELVAMITAQRIYQANAQTIKTQDQVLQTLVNLR